MRRNFVSHNDAQTGPIKRKRVSSVQQPPSSSNNSNNNNSGLIQQTIIINSPSFNIHCAPARNQTIQQPVPSNQYVPQEGTPSNYTSKNRTLQPRSKSSLAQNSTSNEIQYPSNKKNELNNFSSNKPTRAIHLISPFKVYSPNPSGDATILLQKRERSAPGQIQNLNKVSQTSTQSPTFMQQPQQKQTLNQNLVTNFNNSSIRQGQSNVILSNEVRDNQFRQATNIQLTNEKLFSSAKKEKGKVASPHSFLLQTLGNSKVLSQEKVEIQKPRMLQRPQNIYPPCQQTQIASELTQMSSLKNTQNQNANHSIKFLSRHSVETNPQSTQFKNTQPVINKKMNLNTVRSNSQNGKRIEPSYFEVMEVDEPSLPESSTNAVSSKKPASSTLEIGSQLFQYPLEKEQRPPRIGKKNPQPKSDLFKGMPQQSSKQVQYLSNFNDIMKIYNDTQLSKLTKNTKLNRTHFSNLRGGGVEMRAKTEMDDSLSSSLNILNQFNDLEEQASSEQLQVYKEKRQDINIQKTIEEGVQVYLQESQINANSFIRNKQDLNYSFCPAYMKEIKQKKVDANKPVVVAQPRKLSNMIFSTLQENKDNSTIQDFCYNFDLEV